MFCVVINEAADNSGCLDEQFEREIVEVMMGTSVLVGIGIIGAIVGITVWISAVMSRRIDRRALALLHEKTNPAAATRGVCYVAEGGLEEPAAAQMLNGKLNIFTVTNKEIDLPLIDLRVTGIKRSTLTGRYPWFRKTVFTIESPHTSRLRLGVVAEDAVKWERALGLISSVTKRNT